VIINQSFTARVICEETSQLVTWSTRHTVKSCDELTVMSDGGVG